MVSTKIRHIFFSVTAASYVIKLTKTNIENAFAYNRQFNYFLNATFKTDLELMAYDNRFKKYKLKHLYEVFEKR